MRITEPNRPAPKSPTFRPKDRQEASDQIERDIKRFRRAGGKIEKVPSNIMTTDSQKAAVSRGGIYE